MEWNSDTFHLDGRMQGCRRNKNWNKWVYFRQANVSGRPSPPPLSRCDTGKMQTESGQDEPTHSRRMNRAASAPGLREGKWVLFFNDFQAVCEAQGHKALLRTFFRLTHTHMHISIHVISTLEALMLNYMLSAARRGCDALCFFWFYLFDFIL